MCMFSLLDIKGERGGLNREGAYFLFLLDKGGLSKKGALKRGGL